MTTTAHRSTALSKIVGYVEVCEDPKPRRWVVSYSLQLVRFSFWKSFCTHRELTCDPCEPSSKLERVPELK